MSERTGPKPDPLPGDKSRESEHAMAQAQPDGVAYLFRPHGGEGPNGLEQAIMSRPDWAVAGQG